MAFHANRGLYFQRREDGSVWVEKRVPLVGPIDDHTASPLFAVVEHWAMTADEWASVIASMSARGETTATFQDARDFHTIPHQEETNPLDLIGVVPEHEEA